MCFFSNLFKYNCNDAPWKLNLFTQVVWFKAALARFAGAGRLVTGGPPPLRRSSSKHELSGSKHYASFRRTKAHASWKVQWENKIALQSAGGWVCVTAGQLGEGGSSIGRLIWMAVSTRHGEGGGVRWSGSGWNRVYERCVGLFLSVIVLQFKAWTSVWGDHSVLCVAVCPAV